MAERNPKGRKRVEPWVFDIGLGTETADQGRRS
jgi:hypothetical protein